MSSLPEKKLVESYQKIKKANEISIEELRNMTEEEIKERFAVPIEDALDYLFAVKITEVQSSTDKNKLN